MTPKPPHYRTVKGTTGPGRWVSTWQYLVALLTTQSPPPEDSSSSEGECPGLGEEEYEVEYIVDSRFRSYGTKPVFEYLIHWQGYPISERSWTLGSQLDEDDPSVLQFHKKYPKKPRRGQRTLLDVLRSVPSAIGQQRAAPARESNGGLKIVSTRDNIKANVKVSAPRSTLATTAQTPSTTPTSKPRVDGKENQRVPAKRARSESDDDFKVDDGSESESEVGDGDETPSEPSETATPSEDEVDESKLIVSCHS